VLKDFQVVPDNELFVMVVDAVDIGGVLQARVFSSHHNVVPELVSVAIEGSPLIFVPYLHVLRILASVHLDEGCVIAAVKARMLSLTKLVVLVHNVFQLGAKSAECNRKLLLLLLQEHKHSKEGWDNVVATFSKKDGIHFAFKLAPLLFIFLSRVDIFVLFPLRLLLLLVIRSFIGESLIARDAELFFGAFG